MKKYDYEIVHVYSDKEWMMKDLPKVLAACNKRAAAGWDLKSSFYIGSPNCNLILIFEQDDDPFGSLGR